MLLHPAKEVWDPFQSTNGEHHDNYPFEVVLEKCQREFECILLIVDYFTTFAQAYPTQNKTARTVAEKICNNFAPRFGFSARDQEGEFENNLFRQLHKLSGDSRSRTSPCHPKVNG